MTVEEGRGRLKITVKNALQLPVVKHHPQLLRKFAPKMNPYVVLKLGTDTQQTRVDEGGHRAPVWNDTLSFELMPGLGDLEIRVMHKGSLTGKDTEIAYGSVPSHSLRHFKGQDLRVNVTGPAEITSSGSISISAVFESDQGIARQDKVGTQFTGHRSSSVESGSSRQGFMKERRSSGLAPAGSQRMSVEAPAWLSGAKVQTAQLSNQQGEEETVTPLGPNKSRKSKWGLSALIGHSKKDSKAEGTGQSSGQASGDDDLLSSLSGRPSDQEARYSEQVPGSSQEVYLSPVGSPQRHVKLPSAAAQPSSNLDTWEMLADSETEPGVQNQAGRASPDAGFQPNAIRRESGLRLYPAEEGPTRTKTQWLDQWEQGRATGGRRVTESALPDLRDSAFANAARRRMTETHEQPSAPALQVSPPQTQQDGRTPQHSHLRGGREVREWHEFNGPVPPNYKLPSYLQAIVNPETDDVRWNLQSTGEQQTSTQRERETEWERRSSDVPNERLQSSGAEAPILEDEIQAMRITRNTAQDSVSKPARRTIAVPLQGSQTGSSHSTMQYPQPDYESPMMASISESFGGFAQPSDRPFFENLIEKADGKKYPRESASVAADPGKGAAKQQLDSDLTSLPPMYVSPFIEEQDDTFGEQSFRDGRQATTGGPESRTPPTASTRPGQTTGQAVPFTDIKSQLEAGRHADDSGSGLQNDLSKAMTSLQSDIAEDGWRIDESELSIAVDSNGKPAKLGAGSFGEVYRGWYNYSPVAIKVLQVDSPRALKDALDEMKVLTKIHSPNIVRLLGYTITEELNSDTQTPVVKKVNLVTELLDGNLWEALAKGRFTWHKGGCRIIWEVCTGMYHMHRQHIRHLDLKSPNILLTDNGHAKIADFGMASVVGIGNIQSTIKGMGTYAWASPEMLLGKAITDKADVFSLGVILWEICTGMKPQRGMLRDLEDHEGPQEINQLIQSAIEEFPEARPTVHEFLKVLQKYIQISIGLP